MSNVATTSILELAAQQHGSIHASQLDDLGVTRRWLENLVRRGVVRRVAAGVYVVCGSVESAAPETSAPADESASDAADASDEVDASVDEPIADTTDSEPGEEV